MSLEARIEDLTAAIHALVAAMGARPVAAAPVPTPAAPTVAAPAPTTVQAVAAPSVPVASGTPVVMPPPPSFEALAPVAAPVAALPKAPFSDQKSLIDYVMSSYKTLGVAKGAQIQQVLVSLGHQNINDVKPENYDALFAGVEALKG